MKTTVLSLALAGVLLVPAAYGVDEHQHAEKAAPGAKAPASPQADEKAVAQMQEHMKKMQDIMARMQKTADPAERQKLMTELTQAIQEGMKLDMAQAMIGQMMEHQNAQMQDQMKKMQGIMARMQKAADSAERKKLMSEHTQALREGMKTMRGMSGTSHGMMSGGMMGEAPKEGAGSDMGGAGPMSAEMMERRMDMMQMMMEQMMQHQTALERAPK